MSLFSCFFNKNAVLLKKIEEQDLIIKILRNEIIEIRRNSANKSYLNYEKVINRLNLILEKTTNNKNVDNTQQIWSAGLIDRPLIHNGINYPCRWFSPTLYEIQEELQKEFEVPSFNIDTDTSYIVDLGKHSCTCPDFTKKRDRLPRGHALRCCKHIVYILKQCGLLDGQDVFVKLIFENNLNSSVAFLLIEFPHGNVLIGVTAGEPWVDVYAPKRSGKKAGPFERFGFNQAEKRWSYGSAPFGPIQIKEAINTLVCGRDIP